jgi:hypothetical protein
LAWPFSARWTLKFRSAPKRLTIASRIQSSSWIFRVICPLARPQMRHSSLGSSRRASSKRCCWSVMTTLEMRLTFDSACVLKVPCSASKPGTVIVTALRLSIARPSA